MEHLGQKLLYFVEKFSLILTRMVLFKLLRTSLCTDAKETPSNIILCQNKCHEYSIWRCRTFRSFRNGRCMLWVHTIYKCMTDEIRWMPMSLANYTYRVITIGWNTRSIEGFFDCPNSLVVNYYIPLVEVLVVGSTWRLYNSSQRSRRWDVKLAWTVIGSWKQIQECISSLDLTKPNYV